MDRPVNQGSGPRATRSPLNVPTQNWSSVVSTMVALLNAGLAGVSTRTRSSIVAGSTSIAMVPRGQVDSALRSCCGPGGPPHSGTSFFIPAVCSRPFAAICTLSGVIGSCRVVRSCVAGLV